MGRSSSLQLGVVPLFLHSFVYSWYTSLASSLMSTMGMSFSIVGTVVAMVSIYSDLPFFLSGSKQL